MTVAVVERVDVYPLRIPLRGSVRHAAAERTFADPLVVALTLRGGIVGYGETVARPYVTGESADSVVSSVGEVFVAPLLSFHADSLGDALEAIENLPWTDSAGKPLPAARAAVELALLDGVLKLFERDLDAVVRWMGLTSFGKPGSLRSARYSAVLTAADPALFRRRVRLFWWAGFRHFKVKVGVPGDQDAVHWCAKKLARPLTTGRSTLRIDANAAWTMESARAWLDRVRDVPLSFIEQPLPRGEEESLPALRRDSSIRVMHDESVQTMDDARGLVELGVADGFNVRIAKCGGLLPSIRLVEFARKHNVAVQVGCMVGETSILSAAGLRILEVCPELLWAEGCFGRWLLHGDVVARPLTFGLGGRPPNPPGIDWSSRVLSDRLDELCEQRQYTWNL